MPGPAWSADFSIAFLFVLPYSRHAWEWDPKGLSWRGAWRSVSIPWPHIKRAGKTWDGRTFVADADGRKICWSSYVLEHQALPDAIARATGHNTSSSLIRTLSPHVFSLSEAWADARNSWITATVGRGTYRSADTGIQSGPRPIRDRRQVGGHRPCPLFGVSRRREGSLAKFQPSRFGGWAFALDSTPGSRWHLPSDDWRATRLTQSKLIKEHPKGYQALTRVLAIGLAVVLGAALDVRRAAAGRR